MITGIYRRFIPALLVLGFLLPVPLAANKFFLRFGLGFNSQGKFQDFLSSPKEYSPFVTVDGKLSSHLGLNYYLEGIYKFNPWVGCAVGYGYLSNFIEGTESQYIAHLSPLPDSAMNLTPKLSFDTNYVYVSVVFSLPMTSTLLVSAAGGVGYYYTDYSSKTEWDPFYFYHDPEDHRTTNFKGSDRAAGYHIKLGLEHKLFELMSVTAEVLYRGVNLRLDNVALESRVGSTIQDLEWLEQKDLPIFDYEISRFALPRVSFYMGIMFRF